MTTEASWLKRFLAYRLKIGGYRIPSIMLVLLVIALGCCGVTGISVWNEDEAAPEPVATATATVGPTWTPRPTRTPAPMATRTARPSPSPRATATATSEAEACTWGAVYVADVTIPDGTRMDPGQAFVKTWRVRNSGTCAWENVRLVFADGERMAAVESVPVPEADPGDEVEVSVEMAAPEAAGEYAAGWALCCGGESFYRVTVAIVAGEETAPVVVATDVPVAVPTVAVTELPAAGIVLINLTSPIVPNSDASLVIQVAPGATCDPGVRYASGWSKAGGLESKTAVIVVRLAG